MNPMMYNTQIAISAAQRKKNAPESSSLRPVNR
jgi:hypothetical protein